MKFLVAAFVVVIFDRLSKQYIVGSMQEGMSIPVIKDIFHITYVLNPGAAFGIMENQRWFFIAIACALLLTAAFFYKKLLAQPKLLQTGVAIMAGGAVGNLIDRITIGKVVDFLDFRFWPVFNIADIAICVGAGLIVWTIWQEEQF